MRELRSRGSRSARFGRRRTLAQPLIELQDYPVGILEQARSDSIAYGEPPGKQVLT